MVEIIGDAGGDGNTKPQVEGEKTIEKDATLANAKPGGSSWFPSGESAANRQKENDALVEDGKIPDVSVDGGDEYDESVGFRGWLADSMASKDEKQIFKDFNSLARDLGHEPLTNTQKLQIVHMPEDMKEMYRKTLDQLVDLNDGKTTPAQYMANVLNDAADLAEKNGRDPESWNMFKPSQEQLFVNYAGLVMSEEPMGFIKDTGRELVGGGPHVAGSALETAYQAIVADDRAGDGFNPNVVDVNKGNSITHHYREFLVVGYNSGKYIADKATTAIDNPKKNPGDVRDGYFAGMVGAALGKGKITAREAADLTNWAYLEESGAQTPWGDTDVKGAYLDPDRDYDIDQWMKAYRAREKE